MISVALTQPDGTPLTQPDGSPLIAYSYQPLPPDGPAYADADFAVALERLLPRGRAWSRDPDSVLMQVVSALAPGFARLHARANRLVADGFPATALGLLPEWEATLGLPDPCAGPEPTVSLRQQQVQARIAAQGGQSIPYFIAFAAALGFSITITEFAPARADELCADDPVYGDDWAHAWQVNVQGFTLAEFEADIGCADEPLASWSNEVLECELRRVAPAHTVLLFAYLGDLPTPAWNTPGAPGWA